MSTLRATTVYALPSAGLFKWIALGRFNDTRTYLLRHIGSLLVQYSVFNYGIEAANQLRSWTISALANDVYLKLRPAKFVDLLKAAQEAEVSELNRILEPHAQDWLFQVPRAIGYYKL